MEYKSPGYHAKEAFISIFCGDDNGGPAVALSPVHFFCFRLLRWGLASCRFLCLLPSFTAFSSRCPGCHDYLFQHLQWASAAVGCFLSPCSSNDGESHPRGPMEFSLVHCSVLWNLSLVLVFIQRSLICFQNLPSFLFPFSSYTWLSLIMLLVRNGDSKEN